MAARNDVLQSQVMMSQLAECREELKALKHEVRDLERQLASHSSESDKALAEFRADKGSWKIVFDRLTLLAALLISLAGLIVNLIKHP
jgi:septal ring factor EnvC (AmiA/AmiB activator)